MTIAHDPSDLSLEYDGSTDPLSFDITVSEALVEVARAHDSKATSLVAMGILKKDGDVCVMRPRGTPSAS